ncbi:AMP-binding protein [Leucobacter sp. HY1910]
MIGNLTTRDTLDRRAGDTHPGLIFEDQTWSWGEVVDNCRNRANMLLGLRDEAQPFHVGVMLENDPEYLFMIGAAAYAAATVVGINLTHRGEQLARAIDQADVQILVTTRALLEQLDGVESGIDPSRVLLIDEAPYAQLAAQYPATRPEIAAAGDRATTLLLLFTSGSTGDPKAVICSTGRMADIVVLAHMDIQREDVAYNSMPLFHGNAVFACWAPALNAGATFVLARKFSASRFVPDLLQHGVTYFNYVGRALSYVLAQPEHGCEKVTRIKSCFGTEASDIDRREFHRRFGVWPSESYGASEGGLTIRRTEDTPPGSLGLPPEGLAAAVVNPDTLEECPPAHFDELGRIINSDEAVGELVNLKGAASFEGYYKHPQATAERIRGDVFFTGDLGYRDAAGFFYFAGRGSDRLRVDSENFSAAPVERILERYDGVAVAIVYPVPDERTGDQVMATLQINDPDGFDPARFSEFLTQQPDLGTKWAPRYLRIVADAPVTATGKVNKPVLRAEGWDVAGQVYYRPTASISYEPLDASTRDEIAQRFTDNLRAHLMPVGQVKETA